MSQILHELEELAAIVSDAEKDTRKFDSGNAAAGKRVRKKMQEVRKKAREIRFSIQKEKRKRKEERKKEKNND